MSDQYPYRAIEDFVDALETLHKQVRAMRWRFRFMVFAIIVGFGVQFYLFDLSFSRQEFMFENRARYLEKQGDKVQSNIKQTNATLQAKLAALNETIEKVEQDVVALHSRLNRIDDHTAGVQKDSNSSPSEKKSNDFMIVPQDFTIAPQASVDSQPSSSSLPLPLPLPRPRIVTQAPAVPRPAVSSPTSAGPVEVKVGNHIARGQFDLQPIPEELANKMPRLKGKAFFHYADKIVVVDPKDNRIVELLR